MGAMALAITAGNSSNPAGQGTTQSPQASAGSGGPATAPSSKVQPGTASSLLARTTDSRSGIALIGTPLSVVDLNASTQTATPPETQALQPKAHHLNPVLLGLGIGLFVLAIVFFWATSRSAKNTTH
jgi:hypothetical protein